MKKQIIFLSMTILMFLNVHQLWATPLLVDWAFFDNGSVFTRADTDTANLPIAFNSSNFNWDSGLGSITIAYSEAGTYSFASFFDHEIARGSNTFFNESGEINGIAVNGQSWEIDEPGFVFGDIYDNTQAGNLDNTNAIPVSFEDDVSMAMGWDFSLLDNETALISLTLSEMVPTGFYLQQNDPDGSFYFSSSLVINSNSAPIPEPSTYLLLGTGIFCLAGLRRWNLTRQ